MRLLMVAPPGAGKGTQALRLARHYGIAHLSSGDLFRREIAAGTDIGRLAADYLARGDLVPDGIVFDMLRDAVVAAARRGGYVLDGFPRTLGQADQAYQAAQETSGVELQAVIHLSVSRAVLMERLLARAEIEGRTDDDEATIVHRLEVYDRDTEPLLAFYARRGLVVDIDGERPVDDVFAAIARAVDAQQSLLG